jgi:hypothetical protein
MRAWEKPVNRPGHDRRRNQALGNALIRADNRDSLRPTVLAWITPLPDARCISGWAARSASAAAGLSPLAIAVSTFLTKVRIRDFRAWFRAVRVTV